MLSLLVYDDDRYTDSFPPPGAMTIRAFLESPPSWRPSDCHTLWAFDALTAEQNDDLNRFGLLEHITGQLREAAARLRAGRFALIRNAVEHEAFWWLFEPEHGAIRFSAIGPLPQPIGSYFPMERSPQHAPGVKDQREALYDLVTEVRSTLPTRVLVHGWDAELRALMPTEGLATALLEQAALGERLSAFMKGP